MGVTLAVLGRQEQNWSVRKDALAQDKKRTESKCKLSN